MLDTSSTTFDGLTEAQFFAKSIKDVSDHYGRGLLDQKTLDWLNLTQCLAIVYGGRIFAIRATPKAKPAPRAPVAEAVRPGPQPSFHRTEPPVNNLNGSEKINRGEIAGLGEIEFPVGHPMNPVRKVN